MKDSRDQVVINLEGPHSLEVPRNHDACAPVHLGRMPQVSFTADRDARPTSARSGLTGDATQPWLEEMLMGLTAGDGCELLEPIL